MICGEQAEYGGYLELGFGPAKPRYPGALALNTARNCLAYVLRARNIRTLHLPSYLCGAVKNTCAELGVRAIEYPIGQDFLPLPGLEPGAGRVGVSGELLRPIGAGAGAGAERAVRPPGDLGQCAGILPVALPRNGYHLYLPEVFWRAGRGLSLHRLPPERAAGAG